MHYQGGNNDLSNIIKIQQVMLRNMYICIFVYANAYLHAITINKKSAMNLKLEWESPVYGSV